MTSWESQAPPPWEPPSGDPLSEAPGDAESRPPTAPAPHWADAPTQSAGAPAGDQGWGGATPNPAFPEAQAFPQLQPFPDLQPFPEPQAFPEPQPFPATPQVPTTPQFPASGGQTGWPQQSAAPTDWGAFPTGSPYHGDRGSASAGVDAPFYGGESSWRSGYPTGYRTGRGTNGMAVAGLVVSIIGAPFFFVFIPSVLGVIFGGIGLASSRASGRGWGVALAAVILGVLSILGGIALYAYLGASGQLSNN